ncbi:MAG: BatD family protein [Candidatus Omnitrophota bacterium]
MIRILAISLIFLLSLNRSAFAEISIKAEVDKKVISTDEAVTYKVTVASDEKNAPVLTLPEIKDFALLSSAQSSSVSVAKSKVNTAFVYVFILAPKAAGKFTIGPTTIKHDGQVYSSETFEIEVSQGKNKPKPAIPEKKLPGSLSGSEEPKITL